MCKVSARWYSLLLGATLIFGIPSTAFAQTSLTWAKVERLRNRVHLIPSDRAARLARVADLMSVGDALRTSLSSRAELRFNDGSLARVGEQATFRFTPNTRNFQLSNGTVLLLIPPGRGRTTIQTPNAVTGIQGSALFVRVRCLAELTAEAHCSSPVTLVGALTNNPAGAMIAYNESGSQQQPIYAGEMVVIEGDTITQRHEFDLRTFYQTSGLVEGLQLDSPTPPENLSEDLQAVWQEIQDALELQGDFDAGSSVEAVVENPGFIAPAVGIISDDTSTTDGSVFAEFPSFDSSPAAIFHNIGEQVASSQSTGAYTVSSEILGGNVAEDGSIAPVTSSRVRDTLSSGTSSGQELPSSPTITSQPTQPSTVGQRPTVTVEPRPEPPALPAVEPAPAVVVVEPIAPVVESPVPTITEPVENLAPNIPEPVVEQPTAPTVPEAPVVPNIPTTPEVTTPEPAPQQPTPVVSDPGIVPEPAPTVPEQPTNVTPDAPPEREVPPDGAFDWGAQQQPDGAANNPEAIFPGLN